MSSAGAFGPGAAVFRGHFGGPAYAQQPRQQRAQHAPSREDQQRTAFAGLLQVSTGLMACLGLDIIAVSNVCTYGFSLHYTFAVTDGYSSNTAQH